MNAAEDGYGIIQCDVRHHLLAPEARGRQPDCPLSPAGHHRRGRTAGGGRTATVGGTDPGAGGAGLDGGGYSAGQWDSGVVKGGGTGI